MSKLLYEPKEYKKRLADLLEAKKSKSRVDTVEQPPADLHLTVDQSPEQQRVIKLLETKKSKSKVDIVEQQPSADLHLTIDESVKQQKSGVRKATPHPNKSKRKSAFRRLENRTLFGSDYTDNDNYSYTINDNDYLEDHEHNKKLNVVVKTKSKRKKRERDDFSSSSSSREDKEVSNKTKKDRKNKKVKLNMFELKASTSNLNDLDDQPKQFLSKSSHRIATPHQKSYKHRLAVNNFESCPQFNGSDDENCPHNYEDTIKRTKESRNKKSVKFSEVSSDDDDEFLEKKLPRRQVTPYHNKSKKLTVNPDNKSSHLLNRNLEHEYDYYPDFEVTSVELDDLQVSTSEITQPLVQEKSSENVEKKSRRKSKNIKLIDVADIFYDSNKNDLPNTDTPILGDDSDNNEQTDGFEGLNITSDCSGAIVCGDTNVIENDERSEAHSNHSSEGEDADDVYLESINNIDTENSKVEENNQENLYINEDHDIIGQYQYISLSDALLIILHENTKLYFHGLMSVTVLHGEVEILGYTLTPSLENVQLYSPRGSSFLFFETKTFNLPIRHDLLDILCELQMKKKDAEEFCRNLSPNKTVILCKKIIKPKIEFLQKHIAQQVFPKCEYQMPQCVFQNEIGSWNVLTIPNEWNELIDLIKPLSIALLCGGKSVGKSTMLRYMINKVLMRYSEVLVIDLDPGQPEFTIPGCISATVVKEPIFGPNYTHLKHPLRCMFLPHINVAFEPDTYLTAIKELMHFCSFYCKGPILVNYMGFTRGIGFEIFAAAMAHVQPNTIFEIYSTSKKKNFNETLSHQLISEKSKFFASGVNSLTKFDIYRVQSAADCNQGWHLEPRQIREMLVLSYFGEILPDGVLSLTDTAVPVFGVSLSRVILLHNKDIVLPPVVNANLVALCSPSDTYTTYTCHGWGIVRAVNIAKNEIYLLTPLAFQELQSANRLILGSVSLPPSLYMVPDGNTGLIPYVSQGVSVTLGKIPKRSTFSVKSYKMS